MMKKDPYLYTFAFISMKHRLKMVGNHSVFAKKKSDETYGLLACFIQKVFLFRFSARLRNAVDLRLLHIECVPHGDDLLRLPW